jgi:hypothetical protein
VPHVAILGDSIFDNAAYTAGGPAVIDHLRAVLPADWRADLLAVDGSTTEDVLDQLANLPSGATHLVLSVGGNNALLRAEILEAPVSSSAEAYLLLGRTAEEFRAQYANLIESCLSRALPLVVCTIYNGNFPDPQYQAAVQVALAAFNDAIVSTAVEHQLAVIELRRVCNLPAHFANPLEPSVMGGERIAGAIARALLSSAGSGARIAA